MQEFDAIIELLNSGADLVTCFIGYCLWKVERRVFKLEGKL